MNTEKSFLLVLYKYTQYWCDFDCVPVPVTKHFQMLSLWCSSCPAARWKAYCFISLFFRCISETVNANDNQDYILLWISKVPLVAPATFLQAVIVWVKAALWRDWSQTDRSWMTQKPEINPCCTGMGLQLPLVSVFGHCHPLWAEGNVTISILSFT